MQNLKELVQGTTVRFIEYRKGNLWYSVDHTDFTFPVPIEDTGDATFLSVDKGMLFMRYIRKHLDTIQVGLVFNG